VIFVEENIKLQQCQVLHEVMQSKNICMLQ